MPSRPRMYATFSTMNRSSSTSSTSTTSCRTSSNASRNRCQNARIWACPRKTPASNPRELEWSQMASGAHPSKAPSRSPRLNAATWRRTISTFSTDIAHAVSRHEAESGTRVRTPRAPVQLEARMGRLLPRFRRRERASKDLQAARSLILQQQASALGGQVGCLAGEPNDAAGKRAGVLNAVQGPRGCRSGHGTDQSGSDRQRRRCNANPSLHENPFSLSFPLYETGQPRSRLQKSASGFVGHLPVPPVRLDRYPSETQLALGRRPGNLASKRSSQSLEAAVSSPYPISCSVLIAA